MSCTSLMSSQAWGLNFPCHVCSRSSEMQPVPVKWIKKLLSVFFARPERMALAQPGWSMSPVSNKAWLITRCCCCYCYCHCYAGRTDGYVGILGCLFNHIKVIEATLDNLDVGVLSCESAGWC